MYAGKGSPWWFTVTVCLMTLVFLGPSVLHAAIRIHVPRDYPTIQAAIDGVGANDIIIVAPGVYTENLVFGSKAVVVRSSFPDDDSIVDTTIIDGGGAASVVRFNASGGNESSLLGFTIRNGNTVSGGGIYCTQASPLIRRNIITDNRARGGGGIYCIDHASPTIERNVINLNQAIQHNGGGIVCRTSCSPIIRDNDIRGNVAYTTGGGIYCYGSSRPTIANNVIRGNNAIGAGGGIYCQEDSSPDITGNTIENNTTGVFGGGIACYQLSSPVIDGNQILHNRAVAESELSAGGGLYFQSLCSPTITNNMISENEAYAHAGGIGLNHNCAIVLSGNTISANLAPNGGGLCLFDNAGGYITGNRFTANRAMAGGGMAVERDCLAVVGQNLMDHNEGRVGSAVIHDGTGTVELVNNTIVANVGTGATSPAVYGDNDMQIRNCIIALNDGNGVGSHTLALPPAVYFTDCWGNSDGNYAGMASPTGTNGNISANPRFANAAADDYHLLSTGGRWRPASGTWVVDLANSPCLDAGSPGDAFAAEPAPNGGRVNMGAYGNTAEASKSPLPVVIKTSPRDGATAASVGAPLTITFSEPMRRTSVAAKTKLSVRDGLGWTAVPCTITWPSSVRAVLTPVNPLAFRTGHRLLIESGTETPDGRGMVADYVVRFMTTESLLSATNPADGAPGALRQRPLELQFRWPVNQISLMDHCELRDAGGTPVPGRFTWTTRGEVVEFQPDAPLLAASNYTVQIEAGVRLGDGTVLDWPERVAFTTRDNPVVTAAAPTGSGADVNGNIVISFDRPMQTASVESCFSIAPDAPGTFAWSDGRRTLTFNPTGPLAGDTDYEVTIAGEARAGDGSRLGWAHVQQFRTGAVAPAALTATATAAPTASGHTQFALRLSAAAAVEVSICNLAGRQVAVLPVRELPAGVTTLLWSGRSTQGTSVPAGRYLARVWACAADGSAAECLVPVLRR